MTPLVVLRFPAQSGPFCTMWFKQFTQNVTKIDLKDRSTNINACSPMCILEREREHIGSIWSRVNCLALPLAATQSLARRAPGDFRSLQRLTVAIENKQHKQINKQYTKQCLITKKIVPKYATHRYECMSTRIT
jgi:hypothetical protein